MRKNESVTHVMTSEPVTAHHGDPISKIRQLFTDHHIHHLPVVNGEELIGMISWTDMMKISFAAAFGQDQAAEDATLDHTHKLEDIMKPDPVTLQRNASIREAADVLSGGEFHALPVVDGKKLLGIVTTKDLIRFLRDLY